MGITSIHNSDAEFSSVSLADDGVNEPPIKLRLVAATEKNGFDHDKIKVHAADGSLDLNIHSSVDEICKLAHTIDVAGVTAGLKVDADHGLTATEAAARLAANGPNKLEDGEKITIWQILLRQVSNSLTIVLVITMVLSFSLHDFIEGAVITAVILLTIIVGFVQDYRAEQTILSLQALSAPTCKVLRDSQVQVVKAESLVVGDIVQLAIGDVVPADLRLFESVNLTTDEALLTGESLPVAKSSQAVLADADVPIGDRVNMAYCASLIAQGRGMGVVTATAMNTDGKIAALLQGKTNDDSGSSMPARVLRRFVNGVKHALGLVGSPLQIRLSKFALLLFGVAIVLAVIVFSAAKWRIEDEVLIYGICVAVAVIPESLIAVLTLTIAVGTKAMAKSNVVVRRMASLEAVGGVTNVCSDKTGTLTQGKMIARKGVVPGAGEFVVSDTTHPLDPSSGNVRFDHTVREGADSASGKGISPFLDIISLCNLSSVQRSDKLDADTATTAWRAVGEPTEIALQVLALRFNHGKPKVLQESSRKLLHEHAFDSAIKRMTMIYSNATTSTIDVFTKGATEVLLPILTCPEEEKVRINADAEAMAQQGLRVLCLAHKTASSKDSDSLADRTAAETNLSFAGLVGLYDPPRLETAGAVRRCQQAGITVHMLTGDHIGTATAIAIDVGIIAAKASRAIAGSSTKYTHPDAMLASDFDKLTNAEVDALDRLPLVVARCSPDTKVRMVEALHRRGAFCAMTGDGVNDSPALKRADVGIAMGLNGSDVAKQAADLVLVDDDFASIVRAVEEGRRLFDNIQKFLLHLLTSNIAQVLLLLIGLAFKDSSSASIFPLSPLEILWANLVTSSPLALGLGLEPASSDVMTRPPRSLRAGVFTKELIVDKMVYGTAMGSLCLVAFVAVVYGGGDGELGEGCNQDWNASCDVVFRARATVFAVLSWTLLVTAWEVRDFNASLFFNSGATIIGDGGGMELKAVSVLPSADVPTASMATSDTMVPKAPTRVRTLTATTTSSTTTSSGSCATSPTKTTKSRKFALFDKLYANIFLFWACITGFLVVFPLIYLPQVNRVVFKHGGIGWEWGVVVGCTVGYVMIIEAWKGIKRWRKGVAMCTVQGDGGVVC